jgi:hypothetical protein
MYQGTRWVILNKKKRSRKSHAWAPLKRQEIRQIILGKNMPNPPAFISHTLAVIFYKSKTKNNFSTV